MTQAGCGYGGFFHLGELDCTELNSACVLHFCCMGVTCGFLVLSVKSPTYSGVSFLEVAHHFAHGGVAGVACVQIVVFLEVCSSGLGLDSTTEKKVVY
jgi:hypothetical protein